MDAGADDERRIPTAAMRPWVLLDTAAAPDGAELTLYEHGGGYTIRAGGQDLMSSRTHGSEVELARLAGVERPGARVLVGGLGMGFTLRAALDHLGPEGRVTVAELVPAVVAWNRGPLGPLAGHPLADARVELFVGDVRAALARGGWDAVLLDVDNGPEAFTVEGNATLYGRAGLAAARRALRPGGVLAVWSAFEAPAFSRRLEDAGLRAEVVRVRAHAGRGARHVVYVGRRSA